jgi:hypothetical protein
MFAAGMQESTDNKTVIRIEHIAYHIFELIMKYLYSGIFDPPTEYLQSI